MSIEFDRGAAPAIDADYPIGDILNRLEALAQTGRVHVRDLVDTFGEASFLPALLVPALIVVSPLSAIFFLPTVMGLSMALIALQMLLGRQSLWLPQVLLNRSIRADRLLRAIGWLRGPGDWCDRMTAPRYTFLLGWPLRIIPQLGCVVSGLMMPFLELVPMSSTILGLAVVLFSVALLARDGLFVIGGLALVVLAAMVPLVIVYRFA